MYKEVETQRKIFRYWRDRGVDVTGEGILWAHPPGEGFYGLQGYSWWGRGTKHSMQVPERLSARGASARSEDGDVKMSDYRVGSSMHGAQLWLKDKENFPYSREVFRQIYTDTGKGSAGANTPTRGDLIWSAKYCTSSSVNAMTKIESAPAWA